MDENKFWDQEIENRRRKQHPFLDKCTAMIRDKYRDLYRWKYSRAPTLAPLLRSLTSPAHVSGKNTQWPLIAPSSCALSTQPHVSCTMYQGKTHCNHLSERKKYERLAASTLGLRHEQNEHSAPAYLIPTTRAFQHQHQSTTLTAHHWVGPAKRSLLHSVLLTNGAREPICTNKNAEWIKMKSLLKYLGLRWG